MRLSRLFLFALLTCATAVSQSTKPIGELLTSAAIADTAFCTQGTGIIATTKDGFLYSWELPSLKLQHRTAIKDRPTSLACSGKFIALGMKDGSLVVIDRATGTISRRLEASSARPIGVLDIAPDSSLMVSAVSDHPAQLWDLAAGKAIATFEGDFGGAWALAFSPDSHRIASADGDTKIRIYDRNGKLLASNGDISLISFATTFLNDRELAVAGADGTITVLDAATAKTLRRTKPDSDPIFALATALGGDSVCALYLDNFTLNPKKMVVWNASADSPLSTIDPKRLIGGGGGMNQLLVLRSNADRGATLLPIR